MDASPAQARRERLASALDAQPGDLVLLDLAKFFADFDD
jgi:hypothetical protein